MGQDSLLAKSGDASKRPQSPADTLPVHAKVNVLMELFDGDSDERKPSSVPVSIEHAMPQKSKIAKRRRITKME